MPDTSSISIIFDRTDNAAFSGIAKGSATRFLRCGKVSQWICHLDVSRTAEIGAAAILHTADIERSGPRLAGLMLRCGTQGIEAVVVVVQPFPPHARPQITLRTPGQESQFIGMIIPTGAGIRLRGDATSLVTAGGRRLSSR